MRRQPDVWARASRLVWMRRGGLLYRCTYNTCCTMYLLPPSPRVCIYVCMYACMHVCLQLEVMRSDQIDASEGDDSLERHGTGCAFCLLWCNLTGWGGNALFGSMLKRGAWGRGGEGRDRVSFLRFTLGLHCGRPSRGNSREWCVWIP